ARLYPLTKPILPYPALPAGDPSIPASLRSSVDDGHVATFLGSWHGRPVIWAGQRAPDGTPIFVRNSYTAERQSLADLRAKLAWSALAAALGGGLAGMVLAGRLSLRLRRAAVTAERVAAGDLAARVHARGGDEGGALGAAGQHMGGALRQRLQAEPPRG